MHNYNFNDTFSLRSNISYFDGLLHTFRNDRDAKICLRFLLDETLRIPAEGKYRVNTMLYYNPSDACVEFNYPWIRPICAKLLRNDQTRFDFFFNKNYLRFSNIVAEGWELIDIFRSLLLLSLIRSRKYMIHGAAIEIGQEGILIPSFGNTGKTTTSWMLAKRGAKFLTDEFAILDEEGQCFGFPCSSLVSSALAREAGLGLSIRQRSSLFLNDFRSRILSTRFFPGGVKLRPDEHFKICEATGIDKVVFIQNGVDSVREIDRSRAIGMINAIQSYELNWRASPFIIAQSFFDSDFNLEEVCTMEKKILETQMTRVSEFYIVSSSSGNHYEAIEKLAE